MPSILHLKSKWLRMGDKTYSRRNFFRKFTNNQPPDSDPLFEQYSRKELGERYYSEDLVDHEAARKGTEQSANRAGNVTTGLTPYAGSWTEWEVMHLLRRTGFGIKKADVDTLLAAGMSAAVDALTTYSSTVPATPSTTPLNYYNDTLADSRSVALGADWTGSNMEYLTNSSDGTLDYYRQQSLIAWSWGVALNDATSIREKMTSFWYHFIPVNFDDVRDQKENSAVQNYQYMKLLRDNALGNFKQMIQLVAKAPAMLVFLGNQFSTASAPNENFGRELLELFTMGKLPTQNYEEADIKSASKVLSGWRVANFKDPAGFTVGFNSAYHNQTNKVFGVNFGNTTIANQTGAAGANEFDLFFNMLFTQQGTTIAKYVCRRLYRFFVYYDIDSNVEANVIAPLANTFQTNNWDILPVIRQLLKSEHFYDMANRGVMIKSPIDLLAGALRTLGISTTAAASTGVSQVANQYNVWLYFHNKSYSSLDQGYGLVPNVSGWKAYYQEPGYYQNWINTNSVQQRASILTSLASANGFTTANTLIKFNPIAFVQQFPNTTIQDPDALVDVIVRYLLPVDLDSTYKAQLKKDNLLGGQITNSYWTTAWDNYNNAPTNTSYTNIVKTRLNSLFLSILQLAEFQLM